MMGPTDATDESDEEVLTTAVRLYFQKEELAEACRMVEVGHTYEEAIAYLARSAEDDLRHSGERPYWFFTIPSGRVAIYRPGHCFPERPLYRLQVSYLATLAFPMPASSQKAPTLLSDKKTETKGHRLSFWEQSEIIGSSSVQAKAAAREKKTRRTSLSYREQTIATRYGKSQLGWVVKDRGLGYVVEPMRSGNGYLVRLIHLKSQREMASVMIHAVNHERIREWVSACALLTDWNKGIKAILAEQQGKQKRFAWSQQLEAIWWEQKRVKRQLAFF